MENEEGLVLVDQHAAHERILFEQLRRQMESEGVPTQRLLIPLTVGVTPKDYDWIATNAQTLEKMGFALEPFGNSTLKIDGIPQFFRTDDPSVTIRQLVDELRSMTTTTSRLRMGEDVIARTVCRHAIKANDELHQPEVEKLLRDLMDCELPYCCPHGRPTMIQVGYGELEKKFGRKAERAGVQELELRSAGDLDRSILQLLNSSRYSHLAPGIFAFSAIFFGEVGHHQWFGDRPDAFPDLNQETFVWRSSFCRSPLYECKFSFSWPANERGASRKSLPRSSSPRNAS